jgi:hypothetical protein
MQKNNASGSTCGSEKIALDFSCVEYMNFLGSFFVQQTLYSVKVQMDLGARMTRTKPHTGHETHLCAMVDNEVGAAKLKPLVKNAKYICICCCRGATKAENLCAPEPL